MIKLFERKEECCGCTACKSICPAGSINMVADEEGFLYPGIDSSLCIECGLCKKVCAFQNGYNTADNFNEPIVYAMKHKSDEVRFNSSSGGAFTAISDYVLSDSGVVYGAAFGDGFQIIHQRAETKEERNTLRGSKYVQSDLKQVFLEINKDLNSERNVLFSGTPCQVAGLKKYLEEIKTDKRKLMLNDLLCHGVSSPLLWSKYLDFIQKKNKLISYTFRAKEIGWRGYNIKADYENGMRKINTLDIEIYSNLFGTDLILRPSCYHCKFCNSQRPSDIMIGDFWGIEKFLPKFDDNKGISLVFVNTPKGKAIFQMIKHDINFAVSNIKDCMQKNLTQPTAMPENREQFWTNYQINGFEYIAQKYSGYSFQGRIKKIIIVLLKKYGLFMIVKKVVRKIPKK